MKSTAVSRIALVQAAYDLKAGPRDWLSNLLHAGGDMLDGGQGCLGAIWDGTSRAGAPLVSQLHATRGDRAQARLFVRAAVQALGGGTPPTVGSDVHTLASSSCARAVLTETMGPECRDVLSLWAVDPGFHGVGIYIPSSKPIVMSSHARQQWRMLLVHIAAGYRLRKELGPDRDAGDLWTGAGLRAIRESAIILDETSIGLRSARGEQSLDVGTGIMDGSCSIIDCFDTDDRRFILARANAPNARDPRGLTKREYQVARRISTGESCKLIAYTLGLSRSRVSQLLHNAMRKLGVQTREQMVLTMRTLLV